MSNRPKIIAVDFDGTLCKNEYPSIGFANLNLINHLFEEKQKGAKLILWTCRAGKELLQAITWCAVMGLHFDAVNENLPEMVEKFGRDTRKVYADEYIDDRAVCWKMSGKEKENGNM